MIVFICKWIQALFIDIIIIFSLSQTWLYFGFLIYSGIAGQSLGSMLNLYVNLLILPLHNLNQHVVIRQWAKLLNINDFV